MAVRHRVSFRGDQRPWSAGHARPAADVVDLDPGQRVDAPRGDAPRARRSGGRRGRGAVAVLVLLVGGLAVARAWSDQATVPPEDTSPATVGFGVPRPAGPVWIPADQVVVAPLRGSFNRYWPTTGDAETRRVQVWFLDDLGARNDGAFRRGLLVADPTRRAQTGAAAARRLRDPVAGVTTWEWDQPGWGFSLITFGVADPDAARLVADAVVAPPGPSLQPSAPPTLDVVLIRELGFEVRWTRWVPAAIAGGPFVGHGGLDTVEGYVYALGPDVTAGPVLLVGVRDRVVRAADIAAVVGETGNVRIGGRPTVALAYELAAPVGFRITGASRLVFDHDEHITFELASDAVPVATLVEMAAAIDFDRLARFLRTG